MNVTITGPRSVGKSTISKLVAKKLNLKYISSDEIGDEALKEHGGLDKATKSGIIKEFIREKGYNLIKEAYDSNKDYVFDLSGGSVSSRSFKEASEEVRQWAKMHSIVVGLLPSENVEESISLLLEREKKRLHFKDVHHEELGKKVDEDTRKFPPLFKDFCDIIIYIKGKSPEQVADEIVEKLQKKELKSN